MKRIEEFPDYLARLFPTTIQEGYTSNMARTVTFAVTDACSLRCTYCYQRMKSNHVMDFNTAKKFIDMLLQDDNPYINTDNSQGLIMEFIGGEPLLEIDLIDQITDYFLTEMIRIHHPWATRFRISICSNGTEYFNPKVQQYIKKHLNHLSFSISIDGCKELHDACRVFPDGRGSYDIAISGIKHFTEVLKGKMGSKMTLAPQNIQYTFKAIQNLVKLGYTDINLNCVYEEGWEVGHARILYYQLKQVADYLIDNNLDIVLSIFDDSAFRPSDPSDNKNWCGGTGDMISVDYTGNIYPCIRYMPNSLGTDREPLTIGHVDHGLMSTCKEADCVACLKRITRRTQSTDECFSCPISVGCAWCSAYNYQVFGTPDKRATFICIMHKARALGNAYYWNKLYRKQGSNKRHKMYIPEDWALEIIDQSEWNMLKDLEEI